MMIGAERSDGDGLRYFGLYPAIVTNIVDGAKLGRIQVKFPWLGNRGEADVRAWATLLSPYADADQGLQILPEKDSQVVVAFEAGELRRPYIVGAAWNGVEPLPVQPEAANNLRVLRTRGESVLEFDDTRGATKITLRTKSGHTLLLSDAGREVELRHSGGASIHIDAGGTITITAVATVEVNAVALNVHAPVATFDGVVNCTTLNASAAITSPTYSMGAGNIW